MLTKLSIFLLFVYFGKVSTNDVLPVGKCDLSDSECLKTEFQKAIPVFFSGIPELGVDVLDTMKLDNINFSLFGLNFGLTEGRVHGLKNSIVDHVIWNTEKQFVEVVHRADTVAEGHYAMTGRVIMIPAYGNGEMRAHLKNVEYRWTIQYEIKKNQGKDYVLLKGYVIKFDVRGATYNFTNLFNGKKHLSDALLAFIHKNDQLIANKFGFPIVNGGAQVIIRNVQNFFDKFALSDIAYY